MWRVINQGKGDDIQVGGVKCYLAPNTVIRTKNEALLEAARKVPTMRIIEELNNLSIGKLRKLASQRGIKNYSRLTKKKVIEKLSEVRNNE